MTPGSRIFMSASLLLSIVFFASSVSGFIGKASIKEITPAYTHSPDWDPEKDKLSVCTDEVSYTVEPNSELDIKLYILNPMENRSYDNLKISFEGPATFVLSRYEVPHLASQEVVIINVTIRVPDLEYGTYPFSIRVRTDDYPEEGFYRTKMLIVRNISEYEYPIAVMLLVGIVVVLGIRFAYIQMVNRKFKAKRTASKRRRQKKISKRSKSVKRHKR